LARTTKFCRSRASHVPTKLGRRPFTSILLPSTTPSMTTLSRPSKHLYHLQKSASLEIGYSSELKTTMELELPLQSFTLFPNLPLELRLKIWALIAPPPRTVSIKYKRFSINRVGRDSRPLEDGQARIPFQSSSTSVKSHARKH